MPYTWDNPALFTAHFVNLGGENNFKYFVEQAKKTWSRWPGGSGGPPSQDELIGWAILAPELASDILMRVPLKQYRFIDLIPFLKMASNQTLSPLDQLLWSAATVVNCLSPYRDTGWKMQKLATIGVASKANYPICNAAVDYWVSQMSKMYLDGPRELAGIYFGENPELAGMFPTSFER